MKLARKFTATPTLILGALLLGGGVVYALTSVDFTSRAQTWANSTCNQTLLNSKQSAANNKTATICYNYFKNGEQDTTIASQQQTENNLKTNALPLIYDGNGTKLGTVSSIDNSTVTFYINSVNRFYKASYDGGSAADTVLAYYTTPDCTGTAYYTTISAVTQLTQSGFVVRTSTGSFYSIDSAPFATHTFLSNNSGNSCSSNNQTVPGIPMTKLSLPFADPITMPYSIKNQQ